MYLRVRLKVDHEGLMKRFALVLIATVTAISFSSAQAPDTPAQ